MTTDLTFFTNEPDQSLLDRFKATLPQAQHFDILVGYFRASGFHLLYDAFAGIEKIRILVGLNVDRRAFEMFSWSILTKYHIYVIFLLKDMRCLFGKSNSILLPTNIIRHSIIS